MKQGLLLTRGKWLTNTEQCEVFAGRVLTASGDRRFCFISSNSSHKSLFSNTSSWQVSCQGNPKLFAKFQLHILLVKADIASKNEETSTQSASSYKDIVINTVVWVSYLVALGTKWPFFFYLITKDIGVSWFAFVFSLWEACISTCILTCSPWEACISTRVLTCSRKHYIVTV